MPLDYAVWEAVEDKMAASAVRAVETNDKFLARLQKCAKTLHRGFNNKVVSKMKDNIQGVIDAHGFHATSDETRARPFEVRRSDSRCVESGLADQ